MPPTSWGLQAAGIVQSLDTSDPVVALTFDACGGPTPTSAGCSYDRALIDLLRQHHARATLFLNSRWIAANPATADELIGDPLFEIGNHGTRHVPLSVTGRAAYGEAGTPSAAEAYDEVAANHENLACSATRRSSSVLERHTVMTSPCASRVSWVSGSSTSPSTATPARPSLQFR